MFRKFKFKNVKIGWKYGFVLCLIFILIGISTAFVSKLIADIGDDVDVLEQRGDRAITLTEMGSLIRSKSIRIANYQQEPDQAIIDDYEQRRETLDSLKADMADKMTTTEQQELFDKVAANDARMDELFHDYIITAIDQDKPLTAEDYVVQADNLRGKTVDMLEELRTIVNDQRDEAITNVEENQELTYIVQIALILSSILIGSVLVFWVTRNISHNLNQVVDFSTNIANGNLSADSIDYDGHDEIGKLAYAMNRMSDNLRSIIQQVSHVSQSVTSQSEELTHSANEVKSGSEQIAGTMQELASGSENQANKSSELSTAMGSFAAKVKEANENGELVHHASNEVQSMTSEGSRLMETSSHQMAKIDRIVQEAVQKVHGLDAQSQEISKLVSVIKDIADQTNLLSLNAAIEAARAGEHGKGFAVVADEVRKLSEQVSDSVTDITDIVKNIQNESSMVAESLQGGYQEVEQGTSQINTTEETFKGISMFVTEMSTHIQTVSRNLSEMASNSQQMNSSIQEIAAVSEESAAGIEQTSASSQQTSSSMEEVASSANDLAKLAEELNGLVHQFKL
ncbi:methyl-accepting chemotaxis protein [Lentibacillus halodurans]|uniref:Methyl-accepting chemotaxis protein n=1 Tax=Lentibacillus halodurans TaxID=237679 RepID=A0A1I0WHM6_9BACI|nr:methyl-accepting chemotaxis protein [Lentibacillus halodurans]SFA87493.1 methyl-accepting chemotaxis protein [Lentibacillus halodurans]